MKICIVFVLIILIGSACGSRKTDEQMILEAFSECMKNSKSVSDCKGFIDTSYLNHNHIFPVDSALTYMAKTFKESKTTNIEKYTELKETEGYYRIDGKNKSNTYIVKTNLEKPNDKIYFLIEKNKIKSVSGIIKGDEFFFE
jgi:hypothetical protein